MLRAAYVPVELRSRASAASMCTAETSQKAELPHQESFDVLQASDAAPELEQQLPSRRVEVPRRAHLGMFHPTDFPACTTHWRIPQETTEPDRVPQVQQPILWDQRHESPVRVEQAFGVGIEVGMVVFDAKDSRTLGWRFSSETWRSGMRSAVL